MRLFDVNILVHAHRAENPGHDFYRDWVIELLASNATFLYSEWVLSAFVRIVTHPRIYRTPTSISMALEFAGEIRARPNGVAIMPGARHWEIFEGLCRRTGIEGNLVPDAYLAALAIEAEAEWISTDTDFARFEPDLSWLLLRP